MTIRIALAAALTAGSLCIATSALAQSTNIDGAWADKAATCGKVFEKTGDRISLRKDSDAFGNGFVIDGNRIIGKLATCNIKARKQDGDTIHLVTVCSTTVAFEHMQITLKMDGPDRMTQIFPGVPELAVTYERCKL